MQRVQVPTSSLRRKKYSIPGLSCVLIKITSFKTPFEWNSDQCRRVDFMAGRLMPWSDVVLTSHPLVWLGSPGVHSSCPAHLLQKFSTNPWFVKWCFFLAEKPESISTWPVPAQEHWLWITQGWTLQESISPLKPFQHTHTGLFLQEWMNNEPVGTFC